MSERQISLWPRVMRAKDAARYIGMSVSTFREEVVPAIRTVPLTTKCRGYLIEDLDRWVDYRAGIAPTPTLKTGWEAYK